MFRELLKGSLLIAQMGSVILQWNPVNYVEPVGYRLHYGLASGNYTTSVDAGPAISASIDGLAVCETYYFVSTAYGTVNGLESLPSNEVVYTVQPVKGNRKCR